MNIRDEIGKFANDDDKPVLLWLFSKYHKQSQWFFVAKCWHKRYGSQSYQTHRIWEPTDQGRILYEHHQHKAQSTEEVT